MLWSEIFDAEFSSVEHYKLYPDLYPWVGQEYGQRIPRVLLLGESHYFASDATFHHDAASWYAGITIPEQHQKSIKTRKIINKGLCNQWKGRSRLIYRNLEAALRDIEGGSNLSASPFHRVAFMNYFQRPAQREGKSLVESPRVSWRPQLLRR